MMKNVFRGGLRSLIPNRKVQDADEVLDELEEDELDQEEETEEAKPRHNLQIHVEGHQGYDEEMTQEQPIEKPGGGQ